MASVPLARAAAGAAPPAARAGADAWWFAGGAAPQLPAPGAAPAAQKHSPPHMARAFAHAPLRPSASPPPAGAGPGPAGEEPASMQELLQVLAERVDPRARGAAATTTAADAAAQAVAQAAQGAERRLHDLEVRLEARLDALEFDRAERRRLAAELREDLETRRQQGLEKSLRQQTSPVASGTDNEEGKNKNLVVAFNSLCHDIQELQEQQRLMTNNIEVFRGKQSSASESPVGELREQMDVMRSSLLTELMNTMSEARRDPPKNHGLQDAAEALRKHVDTLELALAEVRNDVGAIKCQFLDSIKVQRSQGTKFGDDLQTLRVQLDLLRSKQAEHCHSIEGLWQDQGKSFEDVLRGQAGDFANCAPATPQPGLQSSVLASLQVLVRKHSVELDSLQHQLRSFVVTMQSQHASDMDVFRAEERKLSNDMETMRQVLKHEVETVRSLDSEFQANVRDLHCYCATCVESAMTPVQQRCSVSLDKMQEMQEQLDQGMHTLHGTLEALRSDSCEQSNKLEEFRVRFQSELEDVRTQKVGSLQSAICTPDAAETLRRDFQELRDKCEALCCRQRQTADALKDLQTNRSNAMEVLRNRKCMEESLQGQLSGGVAHDQGLPTVDPWMRQSPEPARHADAGVSAQALHAATGAAIGGSFKLTAEGRVPLAAAEGGWASAAAGVGAAFGGFVEPLQKSSTPAAALWRSPQGACVGSAAANVAPSPFATSHAAPPAAWCPQAPTVALPRPFEGSTFSFLGPAGR